MKKLFILTAIIAIIAINGSHSCKWEKCPYQGDYNFDDTKCGDIEGSLEYEMDRIHFDNPALSDSELEQIAKNI